MIPPEAVEAALRALLPATDPEALKGGFWWGNVETILEAAAPYIRAQALDDAKDALNPGGSYVLQNIAKWLSERAATERTTQ